METGRIKFFSMALTVMLVLMSCGDKDEDTPQAEQPQQPQEETFEPGMVAVDLGLSVKWASCNIEAIYPYQFGGYFAWGDSYSKYSFTKEDARLGGYNFNEMRSVGAVDPEGNLTIGGDAAMAQCKGDWRMPTLSEAKELIERCTWTKATVKNVKGYYVVGKNGKKIFLPYSGYAGKYGQVIDGTSGGLWTASTKTDSNGDAYNISYDENKIEIGYSRLYYGRCIRPVCK